MDNGLDNTAGLPAGKAIREAIGLYLEIAYPDGAPSEIVERFRLPEDIRPADWLMQEFIERDPPGAKFEGVRSFALRLGNRHYPHMKLRISRPPKDPVYLFSVDSHDAFLKAKPGSNDYEPLEELKADNSAITAAVYAAWRRVGLATEKSFLRRKIRQAKAAKVAKSGNKKSPP